MINSDEGKRSITSHEIVEQTNDLDSMNNSAKTRVIQHQGYFEEHEKPQIPEDQTHCYSPNKNTHVASYACM